MGWVVDSGKLALRQSATVSLAMAGNYVDTMKDKSAELRAKADKVLHGHPTGDGIVQDVTRTVDTLTRAWGLVQGARETAREANVMRWEPDDD